MTERDPFLRPDGEPPREERRRPHWSEFRRAFPGVLAVLGIALAVMLALDVWLIMRRQRYAREIERLRSSMTDAERRRADMLGAENENKLRIMVELVRRQATLDQELHLSVALTTITGAVFAFMRYFMKSTDEFSVANHPMQPYMLAAHVVVAPLLLFILGWTFSNHMVPKYRFGDGRTEPKPSRKSRTWRGFDLESGPWKRSRPRWTPNSPPSTAGSASARSSAPAPAQ